MAEKKPDLDAAYGLQGTEDNKRLYRNWAETYDDDFVHKSGYRLPKLVAQSYAQEGMNGPVLDVGCGTGQVARHMPETVTIDGLDLSPEMLAQARLSGRYRHLFEADVTAQLPMASASYDAWVSAGTFTHGHVGPQALPALVALLKPAGLGVFTSNAAFFAKAGFDAVLDELADRGAIENMHISEEKIYADASAAPQGHADDICKIVKFRVPQRN